MRLVLHSIGRVELQGIAQLIDVVNEEDALALARLAWLDDHDLIRTLFGFLFGHV